LGLAVHDDGEVHFAAHVHALHHEDLVAENATGSLLCDEVLAEHVLGKLTGLTGLGDHVDAPLEAVFEGAEAAAARQDLGLDDDVLEYFASCNIDIEICMHTFIYAFECIRVGIERQGEQEMVVQVCSVKERQGDTKRERQEDKEQEQVISKD
jgi:hypothetical protein